VLILGTGRLAKHLQFYLGSLGLEVVSLSARRLTTAALLSPTHIWIAVSDKAIEPVLREARGLLSNAGLDPSVKQWLHSAGGLALSDDAGAALFHPLMLFPAGHFYEASFYRRIPFITTAEDDASTTITALGLPNPIFRIKKSEQPFYHAMCVLLSNLPYTLWVSIEQEAAKRWDLPRTALTPILEKTIAAFRERGADGLTGPWVRGDETTIEHHQSTLAATQFAEIYEAGLRLFQLGQKGGFRR
jgi:hypothetical protein